MVDLLLVYKDLLCGENYFVKGKMGCLLSIIVCRGESLENNSLQGGLLDESCSIVVWHTAAPSGF
tara:strand:+ start:642 stop:836 length:195 start_codon:yes stop_codon:yes gene_type:complete